MLVYISDSTTQDLNRKIGSLEEEITYLKDLINSFQKYVTIAEKANDIIYIHDVDGNITYTNDYCQTISGYSLQELLSMNVYNIIPSPLREIVLEKRKRRLNGDLKVEFYETYFFTKLGNLIPVEVSSIPLMENEKWYATLVLARDIRKRKHYEKKIEELNKDLKLLNKILRHDISNDLTVVSIALEMIETKDDNLKKKAMKAIDRSVELIEKIRQLESSMSLEENLKSIDLRECIDSVVKTYPNLNVNIRGRCIVLADDGICSVIENLINNSMIHGKTNRVDINISNNKKSCLLKVSDYGVGIPDNLKGKIFDEEFSYGDKKGTGLGLYIVKNLVERYGGNIKVEDNKPHGTTFLINLKKK